MPADSSSSDDVLKATKPPEVVGPILNPLIVMTKNADAGMTAPAIVTMNDVPVVALQVPVSSATLLLPAAAVGVMDGAKKPEGYVSVMVPPAGIGFKGVNPSVTGTFVLPVLRSEAEIKKLTFMSPIKISPL